jgi:hypothetical protein
VLALLSELFGNAAIRDKRLNYSSHYFGSVCPALFMAESSVLMRS